MAQAGEEAAETSAFQRLFQHGGDINSARIAFPDAPEPWIDLSTGINPVPYPIPELEADAWTKLPTPAALEALMSAAGARYGVPGDAVVAGPGAQSIIQWLPRLFPARRVAILGPTYNGHASAWRAAGVEVSSVATLPELAGAEIAVIVNPNNPDGRRLSREALIRLDDRVGLLIVDESFIDFERDSIATDLPPSTIVLRSFGKAYGLAGVRLGFALATPKRASLIRAALGAWPVSGAAIAIAQRALADGQWKAEAQARLDADGAWLDQRLERAGFEVVGATRLFRLTRHPQASRAFEALCRAGMLTRPFPDEPSWLRFGLPTPVARARVERALRAVRAAFL